VVHKRDAQQEFLGKRITSNLTKRGDVYYFRARVPSHLVKPFGRAMVSLSLDTTDKSIAKLRARRRRTELDNAFQELEGQGPRLDAEFSGSVLLLTHEDIDHLCQRYKTQMLVTDE
jgi:hypothetical protein